MFEYVKEDVAWQSAQAQWFIDHELKPGPVARIAGAFYMSAIFPQAINDIIEGTSLISCNFPTGEPPNPEPVLRKNRHIKVFSPEEDGIGVGMPAYGWARASGERAGRLVLQTSVVTLPPLPKSQFDLWVEDVIPEDIRHALTTSINLTLRERMMLLKND